MKYIVIIIGVIALQLCYWCYNVGVAEATPTSDTITIIKYDTIVVTKPVIVESRNIGIKHYKVLGYIDEKKAMDTLHVALPIEQKVYEDSTYRAYVSGFDAKLDSIKIYQPTRYITITNTSPPNRWSWGLQGGVGITPKGIQPYIGIGINLRF